MDWSIVLDEGISSTVNAAFGGESREMVSSLTNTRDVVGWNRGMDTAGTHPLSNLSRTSTPPSVKHQTVSIQSGKTQRSRLMVHLYNRAVVENIVFHPVVPEWSSEIKRQNTALHHDVKQSDSSGVRNILFDITNTLHRTSSSTFPLSTASLARIHARTTQTMKNTMSKSLHAKALRFQHNAKTFPRRNAISLTSEQASSIAKSLSSTNHPSPTYGQVSKQNKVEARTTNNNINQCSKQIRMETFKLDSNVFLITRKDGHKLTCPSHGCVCASLAPSLPV